MRAVVVSAMKDEGPDVLEWAAYHRAIGFDDILVYTNDCTDGSDLLLDALQDIGWLHHRRHVPPPGVPPQTAAARHMVRDPVYRGADWAIWIDADEFFLFEEADGRAQAAIATLGSADGITMTWRNFGTAGRVMPPEGLVIETLRRTAAEPMRQERTVKCLHRVTDRVVELSLHRPVWAAGTHVRLLDPARRALPDDFAHEVKENGQPQEMISKSRWGGPFHINHYPVKSLVMHRLKRKRGDGIGNKGRFRDTYLNRFDHNDGENLAIQRHVPATRAMMDAALQIEAVRDRLAAARAERAARLARVMAEDADIARA